MSHRVSPTSQNQQLRPSIGVNSSAGLVKAADPLQDARKRELIQAVLGAGLLGVGGGLGARSLLGGARRLLGRDRVSSVPSSSMPGTMPIPIRTADPALKQAAAAPLRHLSQQLVKHAAGTLDAVAGMTPKPVLDAMPEIHTSGHPATSWYGMPATAAAATTGAVGGWSLMDWLLKQRQKTEQHDEVESAKTDYNQALADEYESAMVAKNAEHPLTQAYEQWKAASFGQTMTDVGNLGAGAYLTAAGALAGVGAYGMYNWANGRSQRSLLEKALKARARARAANRPVFAVPTSQPQV